MKNTKLFVSFALIFTVLAAQVSTVFAAPDLITGTVQSITLETNANTAVTTVLITLLDDEAKQTARITIESAIALGIVVLGGDGNPVINKSILGQLVEIDSSTIIDEEQLNQHPVGDALATFFSDIGELDYETIMTVHDKGTGFGVIAQALWLTRKLDGNAEVFLAIINAKRTKDYSAFIFEDGTTPANWGQFKKAVLDGKKDKPGIIIEDKDNNGGGNDNGNNGNGNNQGGNGNGNNGNDGNGKDKDKNKDDKKNKDKGKGNDK